MAESMPTAFDKCVAWLNELRSPTKVEFEAVKNAVEHVSITTRFAATRMFTAAKEGALQTLSKNVATFAYHQTQPPPKTHQLSNESREALRLCKLVWTMDLIRENGKKGDELQKAADAAIKALRSVSLIPLPLSWLIYWSHCSLVI